MSRERHFDCYYIREINLSVVLIYMPDSVVSISDNAFDGCPNVAFLCENENAAAEFAAAYDIPCVIIH